MAESQSKQQYIKEQLSIRKLKDTPANRKKLESEWNKKYLGGDVDDWRTIFKTEFPQFAGLVDNAEGETEARGTFGDDLIDLFLDAAKNPNSYDFNSEAGRRAWQNKVQATKFYQNVLPKHREWDLIPKNQQQALLEEEQQRLQTAYSTFGFNDQEYLVLATYSLRNKASEMQQKYFAYSLLSKRGDQPKTGIATSDEAEALKKALKTYSYEPKDIDAMISSALTGQKYNGVVYTADLLQKKAKAQAKIMHRHLSELIDQDFSLDDIFEPYKQLAAKTLELNPNSITKESKLFQNVLDMVDEEGMPVSGTEFLYQIKNNPEYGYGKTTQARNQVNKLMMDFEKLLGAAE